MSKKLKRIVLIFLVGLVVIVAGGLILGVVYENEVKQRIVKEVNQGLNTEITVEEISFTIFKKFPYAALHFQNMMALDAIETNAPKDTLLYAGELFLEFNLLDIFTRNYTVRKVDVADAVLRLKVDENGHDNFHFWKTGSDTASSAHLSFQLQKVGLTNVDFSYRNVQSQFHLNTQIDYLNLSGNFQEAVFDLDAESELLVQILQVGETDYLKNQQTRLGVITRIDTRNKRYEVAEGSVGFDELDFQLSGFFDHAGDQLLDLKLNGKNLDIPKILSFIPQAFKSKLDGYDPQGKMTFGLQLTGNPSSRDEPMEITADFDVADAGVQHLKSGLKFKDFSARGRYENRGDHPDIIALDEFRFKLKDGFLGGNISVRNFDRPLIQFSINGEAQLSDLQEILEIRAIEYITGNVELECQFKGIVANTSKLTVRDLQKSEISGRLQFADAAFKIRNHDHKYHGIHGEFFLNANNAAFKNLEGHIHSSHIALDGAFINFVPFVLIDNEQLTIQAKLRSSHINLAELLVSGAETDPKSDFDFKLPQQIDVNVMAKIDELVFKTFKATNISGNVRINSSGIVADPLKFSTSQGTFTAGMNVEPASPGKFKIESHAEIRNIDIQQLFGEFGNFGQDFITDRHLRGKANADVVFKSDINSSLKIDEKSIYSLIDIDIANGELIEMQSLIEVADYIKQNKLLSPLVKTEQLKKRLRHVEFSRLKNQIEIRNSQVKIPEMALESSAMNLAVSGEHGFNSVVDYRINFRLTEILTNNTHSEFGEIKDDGSGGSFFLRMKGPLNNLDIAYDKQAAKEKRREKFQEEKETLKELLKEEFNIFGKKNKDKQKEQGDVTKEEQQPTDEVIISPDDKKDEGPGDDFWDDVEEDDDF